MTMVLVRLPYKQIETSISNKLLNKLSGFHINYKTQYCLIYMLEKWKNTLDKSKQVCAVCIDLSKAFSTNNDWLIAKFDAYEYSNNAL